MTLGSGLALSGSFSVIASMSFCAASTPSICLSVSAICFSAGGCAGAAWLGRHLLLGLRQRGAGGSDGQRGREADGAQCDGDGTNKLAHGRLLGWGTFDFAGCNGYGSGNEWPLNPVLRPAPIMAENRAGVERAKTKKRRLPEGRRRFLIMKSKRGIALSLAGLAATYSPRA